MKECSVKFLSELFFLLLLDQYVEASVYDSTKNRPQAFGDGEPVKMWINGISTNFLYAHTDHTEYLIVIWNRVLNYFTTATTADAHSNSCTPAKTYSEAVGPQMGPTVHIRPMGCLFVDHEMTSERRPFSFSPSLSVLIWSVCVLTGY